MKRTRFVAIDRRFRSAVWGGALVALLLAAGSTVFADVEPENKNRNRSDFGLFSGPTAVLDGNQWQCGIDNRGQVCTDVFGSPTAGGGNWPVGTPNAYIFNTGLQIAGIMAADGGPWAQDTVGGFFFDATGGQRQGSSLTEVFNSLDPDDAADWPDEAVVSDPDLFNPVLLGRDFASQQDSWVQYWEGDPVNLQNRKHPMGIAVTQRSLAWNFPAGNESIIYFIYTFRNATADSEFQRLNEIQFFGGEDALPNGGITLEEVYAAFGTDMDVTSVSTTNFSTAVLPFDIGLSYHGAFDATGEFVYPPEIFFPPFFTQAPGLVGIKYLRSPISPTTGEEVGLTLFSNTIRQVPGALPDPVGDDQLWRYLSGNLDPSLGDTPCSIPSETPLSRSLCFIFQQAADTRFYQASGPFVLGPDDEATIVVAYIAAPVVSQMPDGSPSGIIANSSDINANPPGTPSFHPRSPSTAPAAVWGSNRGCDVNGQNCTEVISPVDNVIKAIERGAGWFEYTGPPPASALESPDNKLPVIDPTTGLPNVIVVPGSLLGRSLVAQTIFDNKFLLGFAPDPPSFQVVEGDESVTIIWDISQSEIDGDPFFEVASDPSSALYNPNYRGGPSDPHGDVEGYRILRGTEAGVLSVIAQFDYPDTRFVDSTCETVAPAEDVGTLTVDQAGDTVAVIGYASGEICPFGTDGNPDFIARNIRTQTLSISGLVFNNGTDGGVPGGGVVRTQDLAAVPTGVTDPIVADGFDPLTNNGVPFAWTDDGTTSAGALVNNFTYFYAVQAFDVNSQASGPISLLSGVAPLSVVPRNDAPNLVTATFFSGVTGDDGEALFTGGRAPAVHPDDGTLAGPFPPSDGLLTSFAPLVEALMPTFELSARLDSVVPIHGPGSRGATPTAECPAGGHAFDVCWKAYLTDAEGGTVVVDGYSPWWDAFTEPSPNVQWNLLSGSVKFDLDALDRFDVDTSFVGTSGSAVADIAISQAIDFSNNEVSQNRRFGYRHGGPRWFSGENETVADPTAYIRVGHLDGVDTVWSPITYTPQSATVPADGTSPFEKQCFNRAMGWTGRAADVEVRWGDGGTVTVRDVTHNVDVPFKPYVTTSWGFLTDTSLGLQNNLIDWADFNYTEPTFYVIDPATGNLTGGDCNAADGSAELGDPSQIVQLTDVATLVPVSIDGLDGPWETTTFTESGQGFGLYILGHRFIFIMSELPAAGTVWTLRSFNGSIESADDANDGVTNPGGYTYNAITDADGGSFGIRPSLIPGVSFVFQVEAATFVDSTAVDLTQIHTVPDPYLATSALDLAPTEKRLQFVNLPPQASIRIYTLTGILVDQVEHDDPTGGGRVVWDLRNRNEQFVASGVYFFHVITPGGEEHVGKFTVVNFASQ